MKFKIAYKNILLLIFVLIVSSCGKSDEASVETNSNLSVSVEKVKIRPSSNGFPWKKSYSVVLNNLFSEPVFDEFFEAQISKLDLIKIGCPRFNELDIQSKKVFYIIFLAAIAEAESDFEVAQRTYNPGDGTMNIGMLQIDPASANRHASSYFRRTFSERDLTDPEVNLMVGAFILKNQITGKVATDRLFPDRSYYWQVLSGSRSRVLRNLQANLIPTGLCLR